VTFPQFFAAFWHLYLVGCGYVACGVGIAFALVCIVIFLRAKGTLRERIRDNFGSGT
jgi:hypothetical protein